MYQIKLNNRMIAQTKIRNPFEVSGINNDISSTKQIDSNWWKTNKLGRTFWPRGTIANRKPGVEKPNRMHNFYPHLATLDFYFQFWFVGLAPRSLLSLRTLICDDSTGTAKLIEGHTHTFIFPSPSLFCFCPAAAGGKSNYALFFNLNFSFLHFIVTLWMWVCVRKCGFHKNPFSTHFHQHKHTCVWS